ncbi:unnamed protein product [Phytophthora fragariaefolia]|uniref:Unnamed protein product n=1 Tax=Phytophthora fragariaefolia TaxID=1490495 RepID=A0A9W6UDN2_9STRA|nr:unnamed protein product [Phytophthora fragariaefolia]
MAARDRTSDFVGITVLFDTGRGRPQTHRPLSRDARAAQQVADQLRQQELCLRELQELVNRKSIIGDDPSAQIATLTDVLKKELGAVERNIQTFQQAVGAQRGRHQQHHQAHFAIVCQSLKARCAKSVKAFHVRVCLSAAALRQRWLMGGCFLCVIVAVVASAASATAAHGRDPGAQLQAQQVLARRGQLHGAHQCAAVLADGRTGGCEWTSGSADEQRSPVAAAAESTAEAICRRGWISSTSSGHTAQARYGDATEGLVKVFIEFVVMCCCSRRCAGVEPASPWCRTASPR